MNRFEFLSTAKDFISKGFNPVCVHKFHKYPKGMEWDKFKTEKVTEKDINNMSTQYERDILNIGIITGKVSGITVVDIDGDEGFESLKQAGIELPETLKASTGRVGGGVHYYFKYTPNVKGGSSIAGLNKVDIRNDGGLVVAPPSVHSTGVTYKWLNEGTPIAEFPKDLLEHIKNYKKQENKKENTKPLAERLVEGNRDSTLISVAGTLRNLGLNEDTVLKTLLMENSMSARPLDETQVEKIVRSAFRYEVTSEVRGLTDFDNALRMQDLYSDNLCYIPERKKWAIYNNGRWNVIHGNGGAIDKFIAMTHYIPRELPEPNDEDEDLKKAYELRLKFARECRNRTRIMNGLDITKGLMSISENNFDKNEWLLNVKNGTIDLKTGNLISPRAKDYLISSSNVVYDNSKSAPRWEQFINEIFGNDKDIIKYVQKAVGYTLTGKNHEKAFFILYGSGNNGKSVFLNTIGHILGDFYKKASFDTFTTKGKNKNIRNDLANLKGARIVVASETEEGERLDESLIKDITGGEPITCRFLFGEDFQYVPEFKMWFSTNHLPRIKDTSEGMWNRVKIIPFTVTIPSEKQDKYLIDKLKQESSGILNWCLEGLKMYLVEGLNEPNSVRNAVETYREDNDIFGNFIKEMTVKNPDAKVDRGVLYMAFEKWCRETGHYLKQDVVIMKARTFYKKIRERGYGELKSGNVRYFVGLEINDNENIFSKNNNVIQLNNTTHDGSF